ncbi:PAS domain-containing protein [bacterium]|nr:PAS domain-containing protein [bacterium]
MVANCQADSPPHTTTQPSRIDLLNLDWSVSDLDDQLLANLSPAEIRQIFIELYDCREKLAEQDEALRKSHESLIEVRTRYEDHYISEYIQTETALRNSQALLNYIIAHNQSSIAVYDREMRYIYVGQQAHVDEKARGQEVIGRCHYDVFPGVPAKWRDAHRRALAGEVLRAEEDRHVREDGSEEWIRWECRPWYEADGAIGGIVLYTEDITERKQAEAALRVSEERYRQLIQNLHAGLVVHGPDTQVLLANERAHCLLGLSNEEALGRSAEDPNWYFLCRDGSRMLLDEYPVMQVLTNKTPTENFVLGIKRPSTQDVVWVMVNAFPEFNASGNIIQVVVTFVDVTEQIQAENLAQDLNKRLVHQERLAAVGQLAAGIAHDFNNILAVIALQIPLLQRSASLEERDQGRLNVIQAQVSHAARLIQQILDFSRQAVLERRPLDLAPILTEQVDLLKRTLPENVLVSLNYDPGEYGALVDLTRMQQMVMNLAVNARDAMPKGGSLRIVLSSHTKAPRPHLSPGSWLCLTVADSGSGILPEHLPHIFEPFFTTKSPGQGSGLGLPQVHGIVKQHGGEIEVHSREGQGTTFTIFLPAAPLKGVASLGRQHKFWVRGGYTVLIVEDNLDLLHALRDMIELLGYTPVTAANGIEAMKILEESEVAVDLVLSDLVMPGMGGEELLTILRARNITTPVLILSGHPLDAELPNLTEQGLAGWLLKPVDADLLSRTLAQVFTQ